MGAAALGSVACRRGPVPAAVGSRRLDRIGLQLYTVRSAMAQRVEATLEQVAQIGYREVEFAGYFGRTPAQVRSALAASGLTAPSVHVPWPEGADAWQATLAAAAEVGHHTVVIPWLSPPQRAPLSAWRETVRSLSGLAEAARGAGLQFAYHNHDYEFAPLEGQVPFDLLLQETDPVLVRIELDLFWIATGGGDALEYFARYPGRFPMVHVKDMTPPPERAMVDVGQGSLDFGRIFAAAEQAGIRHAFVEHDQPSDPMASARASYAYLADLRY